MPIYEYKCSNGHVTEEFRQIIFRESPTMCRCGEEAKFIVSAPMIPLNIMSDKWAKMHEKAGQQSGQYDD